MEVLMLNLIENEIKVERVQWTVVKEYVYMDGE